MLLSSWRDPQLFGILLTCANNLGIGPHVLIEELSLHAPV